MPPPKLPPPRPTQIGPTPFLILALLLLLGFFLPILRVEPAGGPRPAYSYSPPARTEPRATLDFINFTALGQKSVPPVLKILCLYPLLAGIAVLLLVTLTRSIARGTALMCLGLLPILILLADPNVRMLLHSLPKQLAGTGLAAFLALFGWLGLFAGGLAFRYQREYRAAAVTAAVGGGLYLLHLFIPVPDPAGPNLTITLLQPFRLLSSTTRPQAPGEAEFALCMALQMALMIAAAMVALRLAFVRTLRGRATGAPFALLLCAMASGLFGAVVMLGTAIAQAPDDQLGMVLLGMIITVIKIAGWLGGLLFLVSFALADLLLALNPKPAEPRGFPVQTTPPTPPSVVATQPERLRALGELHRDGLLTQAQYNTKREEILLHDLNELYHDGLLTEAEYHRKRTETLAQI